MFKINKFKKSISLILIILSVYSSTLGLFSIKKAEADMPVTDIGAYFREALAQTTRTATWGQTIISAYNAVQNTIHNKLIELKEYVLDPLAWMMANVIIDKFSDSLVTWIQSGFQGGPMFLSDPEGFFKDTANDISGAIINDLNMNWLCDSLKFRFDLDFFLPGTSKSKYACTYEDIVENFQNMADRDLGDWVDVNVSVNQQNIVRRFGDDFRNGGFLMWLNTSLPRNNTTGRILTAWDEVAMASEKAKEKERFGLSINGGFFGLRKCVEYGKGDSYEAFGKTDAGVNANPKDKCTKYVDTTPGQLVQDQLKNVGGKDFSRLQVADEIDEIIGALATTMMGWLLTGGNNDGGVLGYDSKADYSGSNRDHYGELNKSQQATNKKSNISGQITNIKSDEKQYNSSLENYADALYGTKEKLEIILAKLKCIKATSTSDSSDNADCDGADEDIKNISLSVMNKTTDDITSDVSKTEDKISDIDSKISNFTGKYGENATSTSAQALELFDEFENKVMSAGSDEEITSIKEEYCYSYDKKNETGEICGLFDDSATYETYKTHSDKDFKAVSKETGKVEAKMESAVLEYACILDDYTQSEDVSKSECSSFESSGSSSSQ